MKKIWLCLCTAFQSIDGRPITEQMLRSAAKNYDFAWRAARINLNHIRGVTGQEPFAAKGDIHQVEIRPVEYKIDGKTKQTIGLFGLVEFNEEAVKLNKKGQLVYSSVELWNNYNQKEDEWYLGGCAMTDDPAAFGTTRIELSSMKIKSENVLFSSEPEGAPGIDLSAFIEAKSDEKLENSMVAAFSAMANFFKKEEPKPAPKTENQEFDASAFVNALNDGLKNLAATIDAKFAAKDAENAALKSEFADLKSKLENTAPNGYTPRPTADGNAATAIY